MSGENKKMLQIKRVYELPESDDGVRFLVERLWPRGMKKESIPLDGWLKEVAPSEALRRWFGHDPGKWQEFRERYFSELNGKPEALQAIVEAARRGRVTLLYSTRDTNYNNAAALKEYIEELADTTTHEGPISPVRKIRRKN